MCARWRLEEAAVRKTCAPLRTRTQVSLAHRHLVLTQGVKVNRANKYGMTPLHFAVQSGNVEVAEFLVCIKWETVPHSRAYWDPGLWQANNGGDPHRRNNLRQSPFDIARTFGDQKAAELTTVLEQATIVRKHVCVSPQAVQLTRLAQLKQSEADTLAAMRKTERLQANRKINRKMRQFTRGRCRHAGRLVRPR